MLVSVHFSVIPINLALSPLRAQVMDPTIFSDFEYFLYCSIRTTFDELLIEE